LVFDSASNDGEERLNAWVYGGVFASRPVSDTDPLSMGTIWECPQFIKVGDQWALIFSAMEPNKQLFEGYALGTLTAGRFTPQHWGRLTYGPGYYAGSAFHDKEGVACMIHWIRNARDPEGQWVGALSVTQRLVVEDGNLTLRPYATESSMPINEIDGDYTATFIGEDIEITHGGERWRMPANPYSTEFVIDPIALEVFGHKGAISIPRNCSA